MTDITAVANVAELDQVLGFAKDLRAQKSVTQIKNSADYTAALAANFTASELASLVGSGGGSGSGESAPSFVVTPLEYGATGDGVADDTQAVQDAINNTKGYDVYLPKEYQFAVTKLTLKSGVSLVTDAKQETNIKWLPVTPSNLYETGTVSVTKGSETVTGAGTAFTAAMIGKCFKLNNSDKLYTVVDVTSATELVINPEFEEADQTAQAFKVYDHFGLLEIPTGITTRSHIRDVKFSGENNNAEGWFAYFVADRDGGSAGGLWKAAWINVEAGNFANGIWHRGTAGANTIETAAFSNSLEPHQFLFFDNLTVYLSGDGEKWRITGQCNQFYGQGGQLGKTGNADKSGVGIRYGREPLAEYAGVNSAKVPQGFDILGMTLQYCDTGHDARGGNGIVCRGWYYEYIVKGAHAKGYANSARVHLTLDNPQFRGEIGHSSDAGSFIAKSENDALLTVRNPEHIGGSLNYPAYINDNSQGLLIEGPTLVNGNVTGLPDNFSQGLVHSAAEAASFLLTRSFKTIDISGFESFHSIRSDLPAGNIITAFISSPNGVRVESGGNIVLPKGRSQARIPRDSLIRFVRMDDRFVMEEVYTPKGVASRAGNWNLDSAYRNNTDVKITSASTVNIQAEGVPAADDFQPGDEVVFYVLNAETFSITTDAGVTLHSVKTSTSTAGAQVVLKKTGSDEWFAVFND